MEEIQTILQRLKLPKKNTATSSEQSAVDWYNSTVGNLNEEDGVNCPFCKNRGNVMALEERNGNLYARIKYCSCQAERSFRRRMKASGLTEAAEKYTFEKFETTEPWQRAIKERAAEYAESRSGWFYIGGQVGCGKSHICTAICNSLLKAGYHVRYMLWRDEVVRLKACVNEHEEYARLINEYKSIDTLYIDDLFKTGRSVEGQRPTAADINIAFEILNHRYASKMLTVISSECTFSMLMDIDEAIASRIKEMCGKPLSIKPDKAKNQRLKDVEEW